MPDAHVAAEARPDWLRPPTPRCLARDLRKVRHRRGRAPDTAEQSQAIRTQGGIVRIDGNLVEESIDRRPQRGQRRHRRAKIFIGDRTSRIGLRRRHRLPQCAFLVLREERGVGRRVERPTVLLLFDAQDVRRAFHAGEQVRTILRVEEATQRFDTADYEQEIVLIAEAEDGVDEVVPLALIAKVDLEAVGEEGEKVAGIDATTVSAASLARLRCKRVL